MAFENKFIRCIMIISLVLISSMMMGCLLTQGSYRDFKSASEGKNLVLEALVGVDEWSNPIPVLAESWDISSDGKTYTFHLRKGVEFHDGTQFNAETARFFIEWQGNKMAYGKYMDRVEIVDDYTLRVYLNKYYYNFLRELGQLISPNAVEPAGDTSGKLVNYIGTGPFKLVEYKKDQEAVLERNDDYWGEQPELEKVIWKVVPDPYTQVLALKAGELDLIGASEHHSCLSRKTLILKSCCIPTGAIRSLTSTLSGNHSMTSG
ncbi:MAG: hypothetical protein JRC86_13510 [Deltaproteobacteria bacterium]|nr:hypothetical protein [Deltaproteobacteria bacterium]